MIFNERYAFILANRCSPLRGFKKMARAFLTRDGNTGAWDGEHIYYFIDDINQFGNVYERLYKLSPVLQSGKFFLNIIHEKSILPLELNELPTPTEYEM